MVNKKRNNPPFNFVSAIPFFLMHLACLLAFFTGITATSVLIFIVFYLIRGFGVTGGYHRYFSHKSFETSRWFQFVLAFIAEASTQEGVLWWANHHRRHHKYSDTPSDVHSPRVHGFLYSHVGWIFTSEYIRHDNYDMVKDLEKFPELRWINKHHYIPGVVFALIALAWGGWSGLIFGFFCSTVFLYHVTFCINSLTHVYGKQRYITADDSRNNFWFAVISMGEGWHNNHHYYSTCARQGFRWYEIDLTYYIIRLLGLCGIVWNIHEPPAEIIYGESKVPVKIAQRARELLDSANCNLDGFALKLSEMSVAIKRIIEQPSQQLSTTSKELRENIENMIESIKEHAKSAETLPPKLAAIIRDKYRTATHYLNHAMQALMASQQVKQVVDALEAAARSLEFKDFATVNAPVVMK